MCRRVFVIIALVLFVVGAVVGFPFACQLYEQERAQRKVPEVIVIADSISLPDDSVLLKDTGVSVNENSAVVWRYYFTNRSLEEVEAAVKEYAQRSGFDGWKEDVPGSGRAFSAKNGAFEIRLRLSDSPENGGNFAVSANWYGAER